MKTKTLLAGIVSITLLGQAQLFAQATWTSTTTGGEWSTPGNWTGTAPVTSGTSALVFDTASANRVYTNSLTNLTLSSLTVNSGSKDNTVTGNAINLSGTVTISTGSWQTFSIDMNLGNSARTFAVNSGRLYLGGVLSGTGGAITKTGGADLWLTNANTITGNGNNTVNSTIAGAGTYSQALLFNGGGSGTVVLQNTAALGASTNSIRFSGGGSGVLDLQTDTSVNAYSIFSGSGNGGTINVGRATAGAGITHNLGVLDLSSVTMTVNTGSNVTSGTAGVSFTSLSMSGGNDNNPVTIAGNAAISIGTAGITNSTNTTRRLKLDGTNADNTIGAINNLAPGAAVGTGILNLIKSNSSTWTLTATNTYTGSTQIDGGVLQLGNGGTTGSLSPSSAITNNATLAVNRSTTVTQGTDFGAVVAGTGVFRKSGTGNLILSGANLNTGTARDALTFSGPNSGTVTLKNTSALGAAGNSVRFSGGGSGVLDLQTDTSVNAYAIASGTFNGATITVNRATSGAGITHSLGVLDLSSVTLTANTGGNVTSGTAGISFTELKMSGGNDNNPVTLAGSATYSVGSASITNNGISKRLQLDGTSTGNTIGAITNTNNSTSGAVVNLIKANSGTWTLNGTNTYTGTTTVNGGTLKAGTNQAFGNNSAVTMANTAGTILDLNNNSNSIGSLTGGGTTGGNVSLGSATLTVGGDNTSPSAYAGVISGTGSLAKTGTGTLVLSGLNTYSGGTTVDNGMLTLGTGGGAGAIRGTLTINSGATVTTTAGDALGFNVNSKVNTVNIMGGTLTHNSAGNLTLSSASVNMTGGTLQSTGAGVIDIYDAQALGGGNPDMNTAINTLASGTTSTIAGKLRLRQGDNDTTGTVFTVADGGAAVDLEVSAVIENGPFQGADSGVQKAGAGTMVLSGANTYSGTTTIKAGTLKLNASTSIGSSSTITVGDAGSSGAILDVTAAGFTVGSTQTLGGIGSILATGKTVTASGTISAGNSVGILTIDGGTLALDGTTDFIFELGSSSDRINLINSASLSLGLNTLGLADFLFSDSGGFGEGVYTLISGASSFSGALDSGNLTGMVLGRDGTLSMSGNNLILTVVPEPSAAALLGSLGSLALLRRRRA